MARGPELSLNLSRMGFSGQPPLFEGFELAVAPGETLALIGPSGVGKTTLLRLLAGTETRFQGEIRIAGMRPAEAPPPGMVFQDARLLQSDRLFEGSVADNISGFEADADIGRLREAAELAAIWDEIVDLPMAVNSPLSGADGGLSGGQAQRLLLARALYRRPRILFLDEATSQLDHATERRIIANLGTLGVTSISIAHRSNALAAATRFICLDKGRVVAFDA